MSDEKMERSVRNQMKKRTFLLLLFFLLLFVKNDKLKKLSSGKISKLCQSVLDDFRSRKRSNLRRRRRPRDNPARVWSRHSRRSPMVNSFPLRKLDVAVCLVDDCFSFLLLLKGQERS